MMNSVLKHYKGRNCWSATNKRAEVRSLNMSRIKGKDTKPEMMVRRFLHANGFRYKLHNKTLTGKPVLFYQNTKP